MKTYKYLTENGTYNKSEILKKAWSLYKNKSQILGVHSLSDALKEIWESAKDEKKMFDFKKAEEEKLKNMSDDEIDDYFFGGLTI